MCCWLLQPKHSTGAFKKEPPVCHFKCEEPIAASTLSTSPFRWGCRHTDALARLGSLLGRCQSQSVADMSHLPGSRCSYHNLTHSPSPAAAGLGGTRLIPPYRPAPPKACPTQGLQAELEGCKEHPCSASLSDLAASPQACQTARHLSDCQQSQSADQRGWHHCTGENVSPGLFAL